MWIIYLCSFVLLPSTTIFQFQTPSKVWRLPLSENIWLDDVGIVGSTQSKLWIVWKAFPDPLNMNLMKTRMNLLKNSTVSKKLSIKVQKFYKNPGFLENADKKWRKKYLKKNSLIFIHILGICGMEPLVQTLVRFLEVQTIINSFENNT